MKLGLGCALLVALGLCAPACTSPDSPGPPVPVPLSFSGEEAKAGASVFLRERRGAPDRVTIEVVARSAGDLHGAAFRLTWDSSALAFISAQNSPTWSSSALSLAKQTAPGQLAVVWTEKGELGIDASSEIVLGTIIFETRSRGGTPIAFKKERSTVVDKKGARIDVSWRGGSIAPH